MITISEVSYSILRLGCRASDRQVMTQMLFLVTLQYKFTWLFCAYIFTQIPAGKKTVVTHMPGLKCCAEPHSFESAVWQFTYALTCDPSSWFEFFPNLFCKRFFGFHIIFLFVGSLALLHLAGVVMEVLSSFLVLGRFHRFPFPTMSWKASQWGWNDNTRATALHCYFVLLLGSERVYDLFLGM